jgi:hypothetical protein
VRAIPSCTPSGGFGDDGGVWKFIWKLSRSSLSVISLYLTLTILLVCRRQYFPGGIFLGRLALLEFWTSLYQSRSSVNLNGFRVILEMASGQDRDLRILVCDGQW